MDRLRGNKKTKYLPLFDDRCELLCFMVDGSSESGLTTSYNFFIKAFNTLTSASSVCIVVVEPSILQEKLVKGQETIPVGSLFACEPKKIQPTVEAVFKDYFRSIAFNGKTFFCFYDSISGGDLFTLVVKKARELVLSMRQDVIMDITS